MSLYHCVDVHLLLQRIKAKRRLDKLVEACSFPSA